MVERSRSETPVEDVKSTNTVTPVVRCAVIPKAAADVSSGASEPQSLCSASRQPSSSSAMSSLTSSVASSDADEPSRDGKSAAVCRKSPRLASPAPNSNDNKALPGTYM